MTGEWACWQQQGSAVILGLGLDHCGRRVSKCLGLDRRRLYLTNVPFRFHLTPVRLQLASSISESVEAKLQTARADVDGCRLRRIALFYTRHRHFNPNCQVKTGDAEAWEISSQALHLASVFADRRANHEVGVPGQGCSLRILTPFCGRRGCPWVGCQLGSHWLGLDAGSAALETSRGAGQTTTGFSRRREAQPR